MQVQPYLFFADRCDEAPAEGGKVTQPLTKTLFSPRFGMLADKFGVHWIITAGRYRRCATRGLARRWTGQALAEAKGLRRTYAR